MTNRDRFQFLGVVALASAVAACGVVKIKGLPTSSKKSSSPAPAAEPRAAAGPSTSADPAPAGEPAPRTVADDEPATASFSNKTPLNPAVLGKYTARATLDLDKVVKNCGNGYVTRAPTLLLDAPDGLAKAVIVARGADAILAVSPDDKVYCDFSNTTSSEPTLRTGDWPAGQYKIYVGRIGQGEVSATIEVEELARPARYAWMKQQRPLIKIASSSDRPARATRVYSKQEWAPSFSGFRAGGKGCSHGTFPESPAVRIDVAERSSIFLGVRANATGVLRIHGPITADGRDNPKRCLHSWSEKLSLDAGTYYVWLGTQKHVRPSFINIYAVPTGTQIPTTARFESATTGGLSVADRAVIHHYPVVSSGDVLGSDQRRFELLADAPKQLWLKAALDLDGDSAKAVVVPFAYSSRDEFREPERPFAYPKKGEPLLLLEGRRVLATDGSVYDVKLRDLVPAESIDALSFPERARNPHAYFSHAKKLAGADDRARLAASEKRWKRFGACRDRVWARVRPRLRRLNDYPHFNRNKIARIRNETTARANRSCKRAAVEKADARMWQELEVSRTRRREAALAKTRERLERLLAASSASR